jgi:hypothetical protein
MYLAKLSDLPFEECHVIIWLGRGWVGFTVSVPENH